MWLGWLIYTCNWASMYFFGISQTCTPLWSNCVIKFPACQGMWLLFDLYYWISSVFLTTTWTKHERSASPGVASFNLSSETTETTPLGFGVPSVFIASVWYSFAPVDRTGVTDLSWGFDVCFINLKKKWKTECTCNYQLRSSLVIWQAGLQCNFLQLQKWGTLQVTLILLLVLSNGLFYGRIPQ